MAFNQWKLLLQLKDTISKLSNDKTFQNVFNRDLFQFVPTSQTKNASNWKEPGKDKVEVTSYLPNVWQTFALKLGTRSETVEEKVPTWKDKSRICISKTSIQSRTSHVLSAITSAESEASLQNRIQVLTNHLKQYPESRIGAIRQGAIRMLLLLRRRVELVETQEAIREGLTLLGYSDPVPGRGIRILSVDGGGIRAILVLEMLKKLEELTGKKTYEMFDLFCGVSTGAILAFAIGIHHKDLDEIAKGYEAISKEVFQQSAIWGTGSLVWSQSYYNTALWEKKLQQHLGDIDLTSTVRDPQCPKICAVSAIVNQERLSAYIFRNYSLPWQVHSQYPGGSDYKVWQAARASAAAPTIFEEFRLGEHLHQDGGILVNNPASIALHEAKLIWPNSPVQCLVSFGTGRTVPSKSKGDRDQAQSTTWANKFTKILDSATDTEMAHIILNDVLPDNVYYRFNPYLTEPISMVEIRDEKLEQMKRDAVMYLRRNEDKFQEAAKALVKEPGYVQATKNWVTLQRDTYGF